jgi:esterase
MLSLPLAEIKTRKQAEQWLDPWVSSAVDRGFLLKNLKRNHTGFYWQCNVLEIARHYLKISNFPRLTDRVYTAPSLFIAGGQSDYIQTKDTALIQQYFPAARIDTLETAGHLPHIEDMAGFYTVLAQFILQA